MNYSFSDPSYGFNRYNNSLPQGCFPGAGDLNRRLARPAEYTVQSNVCAPEPRGGIGILGVFATLAAVAVAANFIRNRKSTEEITLVKHTKQSVATVPTPAAPAVTDPKGKDPIKPTLTKPIAAASREVKHAWLTANKVDHKYGHLNYSKFELQKADEAAVTLSDGKTTSKLNKDAAAAFTKMQADAKTAGITLNLNSAYRSQADQKQEWDAALAKNNNDELKASAEVAPIGYSEHLTGYAVDFDLSPNATDTYDQNTDDWIKANATKYGFVNSFTEGNSQGVNAEAWHWRFEGNATYPDITGGAKKAFQAAHDLEKIK